MSSSLSFLDRTEGGRSVALMMAKRAREPDTVQERVAALLQERASVHVVWNGPTLDNDTEQDQAVRTYVAGGIALVALRAGSPYTPLVGTVQVVLTLEESCVRVVCGVGNRNAFSDNTLARVKRQCPSRVGRTEFVALNGQTNIGFCVTRDGHYVIPDEGGDDQIVGIADVLHEHALPSLRNAPAAAFPLSSEF